MSNTEYKLGKYIKKFYMNETTNDSTVYQDKIIDYLHRLPTENQQTQQTQHVSIIDNIEDTLSNLLNNKYQIVTDLAIVKSQMFDNTQCASDFFGNPDDASTVIESDMKIMCVSRSIKNANDNEYMYLFKKDFSLALTDLYMANGLTSNELAICTNYIYSLLSYSLKVFIEQLIKLNYYGLDTIHLADNVTFLYKGGNTTRLIIKSFYSTLANSMRNVNNKEFMESLAILRELIDTSSIGDWDYMISIKFEELAKHNYTDEIFNDFVKLILQYFYYISSIIKNQIKKMMMSLIDINTMSKAVQAKFFNPEFEEKVEKFINEYNRQHNNGIRSMKLRDIIIFGNKIESDKINNVNQQDLSRLDKKSYILENFIGDVSNDKFSRITPDLVAKGRYVETDNIYYNPQGKKLMQNLSTDNVYIALLDSMLFLKNYNLSDFHLIRIKMNNIFDFDVTDISSNVSSKTMKANIELVDISITDRYDTKSINYLNYSYPDKKYFVPYKIDNPAFNTDIYYDIPSPQIMFADICNMLFIDNKFVWEDKKYLKRIKRLLNLSLVCLYDDGYTTREIIKAYAIVLDLFKQLNNVHDIKSKIGLVANDYEIIINKYNDDINQKLRHNFTRKYMSLDIKNHIVKIKDSSKYKSRYLEFIISSYIRIIIICNYILNNEMIGADDRFIQDQLQINRIVELPNVYSYINPNVVFNSTPTLESLYQQIRGTSHNIKSSQLLHLGTIDNLPPANINISTQFSKTLADYESSVIELMTNCLSICNGIDKVDIKKVNIDYGGSSLY